jgi:uncharacterized protein (DUF302 family)/glutaredoxin
MTEKNLILYQREDCPFCMLVRKKLTLLGLPCMMIPVEPLAGDRNALKEVCGHQTVPVLKDGENVISDSAAILAYLDETYGSGQFTELPSQKYTLSFCVEGGYEQVLSKTGTILSQVGFHVICKNDLSQASSKLGIKEHSEVILQLFDEEVMPDILKQESDFAVLIPFNLCIRKIEERKVCVSVISPIRLMSLIGRMDMIQKIAPVKTRLDAFFAELTKTYKEIS